MATITRDQLQTLSDFLCDNAEVDFREGDDDMGCFRTYSGRGMYGKYCVGITISASDMFRVAFVMSDWLRQADVDYDLAEEFAKPSSDSMGYDIILYWKNITVEEEDEDDDEVGSPGEDPEFVGFA